MAEIERRTDVNVERHLQTVLISIITGAIVFAANYIYNDNKQKGVQQTQLEVLTTQVIELRADVRAFQSNFVRREEYNELKERIRELERRKP